MPYFAVSSMLEKGSVILPGNWPTTAAGKGE